MADNVSKMIEKPWLAQGRTVFYGQSSFDPVQFMQNLAAMKMQQDEADAKKAIARQAEWKDFKWDQYQPKEIYQQNRQQIEGKVSEFGNLMTEAFAAGLSPSDPRVKKVAEQLRMEMIELENEGKLFNDRYNSVMTEVQKDPTKYDPETIKAWQAEIEKLPTIQEKRAYVDTNNPLEEVFDIKQELLKVGDFPTILETERQSNPNFFVTEEGLDETKTRGMVKELLLTPKYTKQLAQEAKALAEKENIKIEEATERVIKGYEDFILSTGSRKRIESGTPKQSNVFNFGGQGDKTGNVVAKPYETQEASGLGENQTLASGENAIRILTAKGEETVQPKIFTKNGKREEYVPIDLIVVEQDGKRFFNIRAQKATKKTGIKIKENETEQSFLSDLKKEYGAEAKIEKDDDDTYTVTYLAPQTELLEYNPENKASLPGAFIDYADKWLANKTVDATGEGDSIFKKTK